MRWYKKYFRIVKNILTNRIFLRIIGAIIIGISIFFDEILDGQRYRGLKIFLAISSGTLFLFFEPIYDAIEARRNRKKKREDIKNELQPVLSFLKKYIGIKLDAQLLVDRIEESEIDYSKHDAITVFVVNSLVNKSQLEKDAIILSALCNEVDKEDDILKSESYKTTIASIFEKYDFIELDDQAKLILKYYENFRNGRKLNSNISDLDYVSKTDQLTKRYSKTYNLSLKLKLEKDQSEEFRRTLAILIRDGKLNVKQIEKDLKDRISNELQKKAVKSKAFLVLSNKFQNIPEVKNALSRFPHVKYSYPNPSRLPDNIKYVSTRIIYPSSSFQNAKDFLENEIKPLIPEDKLNDGFIAIIPIEGTELYSIPENVDDIEKSHLRDGFEAISAYKTGISINMTELYMESFKDEINIDEILSNIPFNIFVPGLSEKIKNFIIANYEQLKVKFNISRLADWAGINHQDLTKFFIELDENIGKKRLYKDENWSEVSSKILEQASKHQKAMNNRS